MFLTFVFSPREILLLRKKLINNADGVIGNATDVDKIRKLEGHWASGPRCIWAQEGKDMEIGPTHTIMGPYDAPFPPDHAGINIVALRRKVTEL